MIYKFHPLNNHLFELFLDRSLWFSKPQDFNDPFDLKFKNDLPLTDAEKMKISQVFQKMGVCCFSKSYKNILMWSHYSAGHKGVCLGFEDFVLNPKSNVLILHVTYSNEFPKVSDFEKPSKVITTKSKLWRYEREVRLVNYSGFGKMKFSDDSLKEVIFGAKTTTSEIDRVQKILKSENLNHVKFRKANLKDDKYQLKFSDVV